MESTSCQQMTAKRLKLFQSIVAQATRMRCKDLIEHQQRELSSSIGTTPSLGSLQRIYLIRLLSLRSRTSPPLPSFSVSHILQPTFAAADQSRSIKARYLLNHTKREIATAKEQILELNQTQTEARQELPHLQTELRRLRDLLEKKLAFLDEERSHNLVLLEDFEAQKRKVNGLCIR
jgi:hypothetical protein